MFSPEQYVSIFARHSRDHIDPDGWVRCPVARCTYEVPSDLEDVAMERHRSTHTYEQWRAVLDDLQRHESTQREYYERVAAGVVADVVRVRRWTGYEE